MYSSPQYVSVPTARDDDDDAPLPGPLSYPQGTHGRYHYPPAQQPHPQPPQPQPQPHAHQHQDRHAFRRSDHSQRSAHSAQHPPSPPEHQHQHQHARPVSSHSLFDPLAYRGPSAYDHLPLSQQPSKASSYPAPLLLSNTPHFDPDRKRPSPYQPATHPRNRGPWPLRPWYTFFEAPSLLNLALLLLGGAIAYALVWLVPTQLTKRFDLSLYWARAIVTAANNVAGLIISYPLSEIAHRILYSAIWTAVILEDDFTLNDLDLVADRIGVISGLRLLWIKLRAATKRLLGIDHRARQSDKCRAHGLRSHVRSALWGIEVPASLGILFLAAVFSIAVDRTIKINIELQQRHVYDAISVTGDLSATDISAAEAVQTFFDDFIRTWTLQSTAALKLPATVKLALPDNSGNYAYFTEVESDSLSPAFQGYGTFSNDTRTALTGVGNYSTTSHGDMDSSTSPTSLTFADDADGTSSTQLRYVHWARWGIQARCQRLENLGQYLVPDASSALGKTDIMASDRFTALFLTQDVLSSALAQLDVALPSSLQQPATLDLKLGNFSTVVPAGLRQSDIALMPIFAPNGVAQSFYSMPVRADDEINPADFIPDANKGEAGSAGRGWVSIEVVLIRLKPELAGSAAQFGLVANVTDNNGKYGDVGYDVAVCAERFDPYIVQVYEGRSVQSTKIVSQAADFSLENDRLGSSRLTPGTSSHLNSTSKYAAYAAAHDNARNALLKDNGRDNSWVPNPTLTSMSSGGEGGPAGYGTLDPERVADMLASADTRLLLPYLVGNGKVEARSFEILPIARVTCVLRWLNIVMAVIGGCALAGILFVPRLPGGLPRRSTSPISWLAAFSGLRIGDVPANAVFARRRRGGSGGSGVASAAAGDRKSAASGTSSFLSSSSHPHDASRHSPASTPGVGYGYGYGYGHGHGHEDDGSSSEHRALLLRGGGGGRGEGLGVVGGPMVTLEEVEKRLGNKTISYAVPEDSAAAIASAVPQASVIQPFRGDFMPPKQH